MGDSSLLPPFPDARLAKGDRAHGEKLSTQANPWPTGRQGALPIAICFNPAPNLTAGIVLPQQELTSFKDLFLHILPTIALLQLIAATNQNLPDTQQMTDLEFLRVLGVLGLQSLG